MKPVAHEVSLPVDHAEALRVVAALTDSWRRMYGRHVMQINPQQVIEVLNRADVRFVLLGAHGIGGWLRAPRATRDVDVLVQKSHHAKAVRAVREAFATLKVREEAEVTRFVDPADDQVVIDLLRPLEPIHQAVFDHRIAAGQTHDVPDLEMALATKFAAMVSPNRPVLRKQQDAVDFGNVVVRNGEQLDHDKLQRLGELVYNGGGGEILKCVNDVLAGRALRV